MSKAKLVAAIIGNSSYAHQVHIPFLRSQADVHIEAIAYSNKSFIGQRMKSIEGFPLVFADYDEMLSVVKPDLTIISSAPMPHYEQIKASLLAGSHVLVDKAMVCSEKQAIEVVELARKLNLLLGVAVQRRYEKSVLYARNCVQSGELGEIRLVRVFFARAFQQSEHSWRNDPSISWGGVTADSGYHLIDTMLWVTGLKPIRIDAEISNENTRVDKIATINVRFSNQAIGNLTFSECMPQLARSEEIFIYGTLGAIFFQRNQSPGQELSLNFTYLTNDGKAISHPIFPNVPDKKAPIENFLNSIRTGEQLLASGEGSINTVSLIDRVYQLGKY